MRNVGQIHQFYLAIKLFRNSHKDHLHIESPALEGQYKARTRNKRNKNGEQEFVSNVSV